MGKIEEIDKKIEEHLYAVRALRAEKKRLRLDNIGFKNDSHKIYRFRFPSFGSELSEEVYVGVITDLWYSEDSENYVVEFCGLYENLEHDAEKFADCQWAGFDAYIQKTVPEIRIKSFIDNLQEVSYEEFKEYLNDNFLKAIGDRAQYWIDYYINSKIDESELD